MNTARENLTEIMFTWRSTTLNRQRRTPPNNDSKCKIYQVLICRWIEELGKVQIKSIIN